MLLMFFVLIIFLMFVVMVFLVVVIDTVVVVTGIIVVAVIGSALTVISPVSVVTAGIIVVSVIGSASTVISPVSVVTAVTVIGPLAVIFLRWPTPAIAGKKGHTSRHQRHDESDEDDFPHISISHIIGSLLARLDSISQLPLFMYKRLDFHPITVTGSHFRPHRKGYRHHIKVSTREVVERSDVAPPTECSPLLIHFVARRVPHSPAKMKGASASLRISFLE